MKQYIMRNRVVTIVTLLILATTTGCGKLDTDNMLLGTWQSVQKDSSIASDTDLEITFLSDGTASFRRFDFLSGEMMNYTEDYSIDRKKLTIGDYSYTIEKLNKTEMTWKQVGYEEVYSHFKRK